MMSGTTDLMREIKILKAMNERLHIRIKNLEAVNDDLREGWDKTLEELQKKEV